eukprot:2525456-Pleurochrysis_carterae.AAC.3
MVERRGASNEAWWSDAGRATKHGGEARGVRAGERRGECALARGRLVNLRERTETESEREQGRARERARERETGRGREREGES